MAKAKNSNKAGKSVEVEALRHKEAKRKNIPTAEFESVMDEQEKTPIQVAYERRNRDLDPQLVWRGKDEQDWSDLIVSAPPLYIQEKVHPQVLIEDLKRQTRERKQGSAGAELDLFHDFNGLKDIEAKTEFYAHNQNWTNRMILGDSLSIMASLAEREGLRGQVQCIYFDPPYGIKFNSNFQWSTTSRDVKDGRADHITREPEQVKAFRDTWRDGIHSYLTYLRDRLTVSRDLLTESGSIFVQIGEENVHRVRAVLDEVFGDANFISQINFKTTGGAGSPTGGTETLASVNNFILWYAKNGAAIKYRQPYRVKGDLSGGAAAYNKLDFFDTKERRSATDVEKENVPVGARLFRWDNLTSQSSGGPQFFDVELDGTTIPIGKSGWKTTTTGMERLKKAKRIGLAGKTLSYIRYIVDFPVYPLNNSWDDTVTAGFASDKLYVVQTNPKVIERCLLMATDPGDLVLDPTCGSGTTAYVAEQWGRRWITMDTSRVALALARSRIMGARYPYYLLADSGEGQKKEAEVTRSAPKTTPTRGDVRQGFVYERVPHIMLSSISNNAEIDVIWDKWQETLEPLRKELNSALKQKWEEWNIPREADEKWPVKAKELHQKWWEARIGRQKEIDASIAAKAEFEYLYDKPYNDNGKVRVAGPFTVESLSPHRVLTVDNEDLIDTIDASEGKRKKTTTDETMSFAEMVIENLRVAGVQQAHKENKINFISLVGWPGDFICAEGKFLEGEKTKRAGIFIGPEFGTVSRPDLVAAAREAGDAGFDVLIACAFNYDAHSSEFDKLGRIPVLKARMNSDLHMAGDLKTTASGNLFVIFGEPDIEIEKAGKDEIRVKINGIDVFKPQTGEIESGGPDSIALWMLDTDYNEESFFVRQAYFLGANDPYKALKTSLKAEIDEAAWNTLNSDTSRPFPKPKSGRIAVKVINHLGDEVMKIFNV
jgi:adenine-specific DNA-methyltransferase